MYKAISESDLIFIEGYVPPEEDIIEHKKLLWSLGLNVVSPHYEEQNLQHRNIFNQVVTCRRWVAPERTDATWIRGGSASLEAVIASSKDKALRSNLLGMSKRMTSVETTGGSTE